MRALVQFLKCTKSVISFNYNIRTKIIQPLVASSSHLKWWLINITKMSHSPLIMVDKFPHFTMWYQTKSMHNFDRSLESFLEFFSFQNLNLTALLLISLLEFISLFNIICHYQNLIWTKWSILIVILINLFQIILHWLEYVIRTIELSVSHFLVYSNLTVIQVSQITIFLIH